MGSPGKLIERIIEAIVFVASGFQACEKNALRGFRLSAYAKAPADPP